MATPAQRAKEEIQRAEKEIRKLMDQLKEGTLDRKKLVSGLRMLKTTLGMIPPHNPKYGHRC
jgi:plasmid stabilization system protein ParE